MRPFRFADVRHDVELAATDGYSLPAELCDEATLALVEAVEAARDYYRQSLPYRDDRDALRADERLRRKLARFDFEDAS